MKECYPCNKMRPVTDGLIGAQHAIEALVVKGDEENIFDYRKSNPELYKLFMDINELVSRALEMYNN